MKENLILSVVGDNSLHKYWIEGNKNFDLLLIYYGDYDNKYKEDSDFYYQIKGNKYFLFYNLIKKEEALFKKYKSILILDDDLYTETPHLNNFFKIFNEQEFYLAQPSLMGWYNHEITLHDPKWLWRCTNFVEIMCPCFSFETLKLCLETFTESESGWGMDWVWPKLLKYPQNKIAIIDDSIVLHSREPLQGDFYKNNKIKITNYDELAEGILKKYEIKEKEFKIFWDNSKWKNVNWQESQHRIYPHLQIFREYIKNLRINKRIPLI